MIDPNKPKPTTGEAEHLDLRKEAKAPAESQPAVSAEEAAEKPALPIPEDQEEGQARARQEVDLAATDLAGKTNAGVPGDVEVNSSTPQVEDLPKALENVSASSNGEVNNLDQLDNSIDSTSGESSIPESL